MTNDNIHGAPSTVRTPPYVLHADDGRLLDRALKGDFPTDDTPHVTLDDDRAYSTRLDVHPDLAAPRRPG